MPLLRSESLSGKCAELHTVAASNSRGHKTTLVVTISKYCTINCSLALQALLEITHHDHCIGITLLLLVHATYIGVILAAHPVRGESQIQRNANREVATPLRALSYL